MLVTAVDVGIAAGNGMRLDMADYYNSSSIGGTAVNVSNVVSNVTVAVGQRKTNDTEEIDPFYFYETEQFTVLWLLFVIIVAGNMAVLCNLLYGHKKKSRMNFFIIQLALADLLVGVISVLTDIVQRYSVAWYAGNYACKTIRFAQVVVTYSSTYVLVALSIDRYDAITRPMNFSRGWWRAKALVIAAWGISALYGVPIFFFYEEKLIEGKPQCWIDLGSETNWRIYMTIVSVTLFVIPTVIITGCYMVIIYTIWSQSTELRQDAVQDTRRASSRGIIPRAKIKTVKMTLVIVFVFILCWSPYIVFDLLQVYGQIPKSQTNTAIATFIQSLTPLNSAANPIIYCLFSTPFCKTVRNAKAMSWFTSLCTKNPQRCFGTNNVDHHHHHHHHHHHRNNNNQNQSNSTRTTTVTTSLTGQSSRRSGQISVIHHPSSRKRVMVSIV